MKKKLFYNISTSKYLLLCLVILAFQTNIQAQKLSQFFIIPGNNSKIELATSQELNLFLKYGDSAGSIYDAVPLQTPFRWLVNGSEANNIRPSNGSMQLLKGNKAIYTAPYLPPAKNPVDISVVIQNPLTQKSREIHCKVYIKESVYKITLDAEQTLPLGGQDIKLHGECKAILKAAADGTFFLEPIDKTRNMQVKVEKGILADKDGSSVTLIAPLSYTFPFLFEISKMDKTHPIGDGTMNLYYISPQTGQVIWKIEGNGHVVIQTIDIDKGFIATDPGTVVHLGIGNDAAKNAIAMSTATQLNLIASINRMNIGNTVKNINRNRANSEDMMAFAKRMQPHQNDSKYFQTKQGKADLKRIMALRNKVGSNNITDQSTFTQKLNQHIDNQYANNPNYAGSKKMYGDVGKEQASEMGHSLMHNGTPMAQVAPGYASLRIEGKFDPKSATAFYKEIKGASMGGGQQQTVFKIKVVKIK